MGVKRVDNRRMDELREEIGKNPAEVGELRGTDGERAWQRELIG